MQAANGLKRRAAPMFLSLLALLACRPALGFIGPPPGGPPGLIIKLKSDLVTVAAAGTADMQRIAGSSQLFKLTITDGKKAKDKAAELQLHRDIELAVPDDWVHIAGGRMLQATRPPRPPPRPQSPRPPPLQAKPRPPPPQLRQQQPPVVRRPPPPRPRPRPPAPRPRPRPPPVVRKPNDQYYDLQWGLESIRAPHAWSHIVDASAVHVCIVDTGVKFNHPDLVPNLVPMSAEWQQNNFDDYLHGTHVAGIIGAAGNNRIGVSGVAWKASMLACKALDSTGWGLTSSVIQCILWCRSQKARVINTSLVTSSNNELLKQTVNDTTRAGVFFATAAGNIESDTPINIDKTPRYPASWKIPGVVSVANMNEDEVLDGSSNYGPTTVHVAAPGTNILSTWLRRDSPQWQLHNGTWVFLDQVYYSSATGTSLSAPMVAGAAALAIAASGGTLTNVQVANLLMKTSTFKAGLNGKVISNGVINLEKLISAAISFGQAARAAATAAR